MYSTGNPERDSLLRDAIAKVIGQGKTPSLKLVARALPADFALGQDELDGMLADMPDKPPMAPQVSTTSPRGGQPALMIAENPEGHALAAPDIAQDFADPDAEPAELSRTDDGTGQEAPDANISQGQARVAVELAHKRLSTAQVAVITARQRHADTKSALAKAITAWATEGDGSGLTQEQRQQKEIRAHLAGEQARRAGLKAAGLPTQRMRTDKHLAPGQTHFRGNQRGALPRTFQNRNIHDMTMLHGARPVKA